MVTRLYLSCDAAAEALGADETAMALRAAATARGIDLDLKRVGSRGMVWLEPLLEVEDAEGRRIAYGPVTADHVEALVQAGLFAAGPHALRLGRVEDLPYFAKQQRLTFARVGVIEPCNVDEYIAHGGYAGLQRALTLAGTVVVQEVTDSGLRGRGGVRDGVLGGPHPHVELAVLVAELRGRLALHRVPHQPRGLRGIEVDRREPLAIERDLHLGITHPHRGLDVLDSADPAHALGDALLDFIMSQPGIDAVSDANIFVHQVGTDRLIVRHGPGMLQAEDGMPMPEFVRRLIWKASQIKEAAQALANRQITIRTWSIRSAVSRTSCSGMGTSWGQCGGCCCSGNYTGLSVTCLRPYRITPTR